MLLVGAGMSIRIRFRSTFIATLLLFVSVTAFLVGATTYYSARFTARDLSSQVLKEASDRVVQQVEEVTRNAVAASLVTRGLIASGVYGVRDFLSLVPYWVQEVGVERTLTSIFIGLEATGESTGVSRLQGRLSIWESNRDAATDRLMLREYYPGDYPGKPFSFDPSTPPLDARGRPWFVAAKAAGHPVWAETFALIGVKGVTGVFGTTYATPLYDRDNALVGALTVGFELGQLSAFVETVRVGRTGVAFIVEHRADGTDRVIVQPERSKKGADDYRVRGLLEAGRGGEARFDVDGITYVGVVQPLSGVDTPRWSVGVYVQEAEVLERVDGTRKIAIGIALGGLLLAIICGLYVARQVARPLEALSREMAAIGRLELEPRPVTHSIVLEVDRVAVAAEEIKSDLRQKRVLEKYVPRGARVDIARNRGADVALGGERTRRSILFSDLRGFTSMSEQLAPDAVVKLLNAYLEIMTAEIHKHGGDINEYIGDAILAVFANSADAVTAALAMQAALASSTDAAVQALRMGIGIHTGELVEGNIGASDRVKFGVIGDTVNVAARIQDRSRDGVHTCIFTSQVVQDEALNARFVLVGDLVMKGKADPVRVYEVLGAGAAPMPSGA